MNVNQMKDAIKACYSANLPLFVSGPPGVGKSSGVYQACDELGDLGMIEIRGSTADPSEVSDIKWVVDNKVVSLPQSWVPTVESIKRGEHKERGIIFLEEISDAALMVQSCFQQLVLDRRLGSARLAPGWLPVAAGNRRGDKGAAGRVSTALANRYVHVTVEADVDVTVQFAYKMNWNPIVPAFLRWRPNLITTFDPSSSEMAFASPRTYEMLSKLVAVPYLDKGVRSELLMGTIGPGAGSEFLAYESIYQELPDMKELKKSPGTFPIPENPSVVWAIIANLLASLKLPSDYTTGWTFVRRLGPEIRIVYSKDALKLCPAIEKTVAWDEFCIKHTDYLI